MSESASFKATVYALILIATILITGCAHDSVPTTGLPLAEYEGLYEYQNDTTLIIVAGPQCEKLYAVVNGAPSPYVYRAPPALDDGIPTATLPAADPLRDRLQAMINAIHDDAYPYTQSVLVLRDGALVFEEYFYEFDRATPHQLRSATKTLMAILAGIAIDDGLFTSIDERVLPYFEV